LLGARGEEAHLSLVVALGQLLGEVRLAFDHRADQAISTSANAA